MGHENNITKSYKVNGKTKYYNVPDPKHKTPDMSLPKEYGKQYDDFVDSTTQAVLRYRQGNFVSTYMDEPEPMKIEGEYKYYVG